MQSIIVSFCFIQFSQLQIQLKSALLDLLLSLEPHGNGCWFITPACEFRKNRRARIVVCREISLKGCWPVSLESVDFSELTVGRLAVIRDHQGSQYIGPNPVRMSSEISFGLLGLRLINIWQTHQNTSCSSPCITQVMKPLDAPFRRIWPILGWRGFLFIVWRQQGFWPLLAPTTKLVLFWFHSFRNWIYR